MGRDAVGKMRHVQEDWGVESVDPSQTSSGNSSFKRVVHKVNSNARCRYCLWLVALFCAANVMFMLIGYDLVVEKVAVGHMVLQEGNGPRYEAWKQAPMPVYYKVTVFNLTNPHSFMKGDPPRLKECGPYTYRMLEKKIDVEFHDNDTVTYRNQPMYIFEESLSRGREEDVIWTVNIPFINAADAVKNHPFLKTIIQVAQKIHGFKTLRQLSVRDLLWGYQSHVMDWARSLQDVPYPHPQFGLLVGFNNTAQEPYTMYTGASDPNTMNRIYSWNGLTKLDFWSGDYCNEIKGTDASGFHPGVKPSDKLFIFNGQLCRSLPLVYERTVVHSGVETYRFVPPPDTFAYDDQNSQNWCFCSRSGCPLRGLLDMKPCYYGAAVAFSFPHFYQSDPSLKHVVRGLK